MAERLSIDTTFLIDLQRERRHGHTEGPAHRFLRGSPHTELYLSSVALGEFAEGFPSTEHPLVRSVRAHHVLLPVDTETALVYADVARELRSRGALIGTNDLWIGCTGLRHDLPVLTANEDEFRRIPGLKLIGYR